MSTARSSGHTQITRPASGEHGSRGWFHNLRVVLGDAYPVSSNTMLEITKDCVENDKVDSHIATRHTSSNVALKSGATAGDIKPNATRARTENVPVTVKNARETLLKGRSKSLGHDMRGTPELCPFCDDPWPENPSDYLMTLLIRTMLQAQPQPRLTNANGLDAPLAVCADVCVRHRSEAHCIPEGITHGWPTMIDFDKVPERLKHYTHELTYVATHPMTTAFFIAAAGDIVHKGARVAASAMGQYSSFERYQPGYYGEQGALVIRRTLDSMFPDLSHETCCPLEPAQFREQVLVPEAAILLIQEDLRVKRDVALSVLVKSRVYGTAQFPAEEDDDTETLWDGAEEDEDTETAWGGPASPRSSCLLPSSLARDPNGPPKSNAQVRVAAMPVQTGKVDLRYAVRMGENL